MFLDSHHTVLTFRSQFDLLYVVLAFLFPFLKSSNHFKTTDIGLQISQASENVWKVLWVLQELLSKFGGNIVSRICI